MKLYKIYAVVLSAGEWTVTSVVTDKKKNSKELFNSFEDVKLTWHEEPTKNETIVFLNEIFNLEMGEFK